MTQPRTPVEPLRRQGLADRWKAPARRRAGAQSSAPRTASTAPGSTGPMTSSVPVTPPP